MLYKYKVSQTIYKFIDVEAADEEEAYNKIEAMFDDGLIRFDDESFLNIECNFTMTHAD